MNSVMERMPVLILSPHGRCNCRCVMCDIWKTTDAREMSAGELARHLADMESLRMEWVVFSGGEPLMHSDLFRLSALLKVRNIRRTLLSTGLLLQRHAAAIVDSINDVIVSLDGPPAVHDRIRGVPNAFAMLEAGVRALHSLRPDFPVSARCTVQRLNCGSLTETIEAARALGLSGISFLAADVASEAFNRAGGWAPGRQSAVALSTEELPVLDAQIARIVQDEGGRHFVAESPSKLRRIAEHFRAHLGISDPVSPRCNAPWVSAVLEADGTVRPCFFHPPLGNISGATALLDVLNSPQAVAFRESLDVTKNAVCRRCVCSLNWKSGD